MSRDLSAATSDDVSITSDGVRLDSKEKVLAFLGELERERQGGSGHQGFADHRLFPPKGCTSNSSKGYGQKGPLVARSRSAYREKPNRLGTVSDSAGT